MVDVPITKGRVLDELDGTILPAPETVPVTKGRVLDELDGSILPAPKTIPVAKGRVLDELDGRLIEGPFVRGITPLVPYCVDAATAVVKFEIVAHLPATVDLSTVVVTVTFDGTTTETVYTGSAFTAGYAGVVTHSSTAIEDIQAFTAIQRVAGWPDNTTIDVTVTGQDSAANPIEDGTWTWCTLPLVIPPVVYTPVPNPASDTIRGGTRIVLYTLPAVQMLDTSRDEDLDGTALPSSLTEIGVGSGAASPTSRGLVLTSGPTIGSEDRVVTVDTDYEHFDVAVDVTPLSPLDAAQGPVTLAALEARIDASNAFRVGILLRGSGPPVAYSELELGGVVQAGGSIALAGSATTLRLVRNGAQVFALIGDRATDGTYTSSTPLLVSPLFGTAGASIAMFVANRATRHNVRARFARYTVRSHATIAGRLLFSKEDRPRNRLAGRVPAAGLGEVGLTDIHAFGLFGEAIGIDAFEYTLPSPRTVGPGARIYQDPQLRDPEE